MSTEQNKAVVRRFMTEVLADGNLAVVDEVLAPTYKNLRYGVDAQGFKGLLPQLDAQMPERHFNLDDLVAEGDRVVARFSCEYAKAPGQKATFRGLTYYRLADGKIVEDEPMNTPDL